MNTDNSKLEEWLEQSRAERGRLERELEDTRGELEEKCRDEEGKNTFLCFTQEQLNSQVQSLESVVRNLKVENQLLNQAVNKLVKTVQEEKRKLKEVFHFILCIHLVQE